MRKTQLDEFELMQRKAMLETIVHHEGLMIRQHYTDLSNKCTGKELSHIKTQHEYAVSQLLAWKKYFEISLRNRYSCWESKMIEPPSDDCFPLTRERWTGLLTGSANSGTIIEQSINKMCIEFVIGWISGGFLENWLIERDELRQQINRLINTAIGVGRQGKGGLTSLIVPKLSSGGLPSATSLKG